MSNEFLEGLRVNAQPRSVVSEFLDIVYILQREGYNIRKIPQKMGGKKSPRWTTIGDLRLPESLLVKYPQLRKDYQIGRNINEMKRILAGKSRVKCTDEQLEILNEIFSGKNTSMEELIEVIKILAEDMAENGGNVNNIQLRDKNVGATLGKLYYDGIISHKAREEFVKRGYDADFPIGQRIIGARRLVDGSKTNYSATPEQINELKKYINPSRTYTKDK